MCGLRIRHGMSGVLLGLLANCATNPANSTAMSPAAASTLEPPDDPSPDGWSVDTSLITPEDGDVVLRTSGFKEAVNWKKSGLFYLLRKGPNGDWAYAEEGDPQDPGVEMVWLGESKVRLAAGGMRVCTGLDRWSPETRRTTGYCACNSGFMVVDRVVPESTSHQLRVDRNALIRAVRTAGLIDRYPRDHAAYLAKLDAELDKQAQTKREQERAAREHDIQMSEDLARARAARAQTLRQHLAIGDQTHCGLVVEIRRPIVKVQTKLGERWLKIDQLHWPGDAPCNFRSGEYLDP